jgi:hypothetical protein
VGSLTKCLPPASLAGFPSKESCQQAGRTSRGGGRNRTAVRGFAGVKVGFAAVRFETDLQVRHRESSKGFARVRVVPRYVRGMKPPWCDRLDRSGRGFHAPLLQIATVAKQS